uniref:aralkylamine N-acetyltransferase n=1 Tax=Strongyloides venezuelensis TaxID=75913 RepID=A0A0K0FAG0_STRVS
MAEKSNITIRYADKDDRKDIVEFLLSDFLVNETLNSSVGLSREDAGEFFTQLTDAGLKRQESCIILNEKNKIIGCRIGCIMNREDKKEEDFLMKEEIINNDGSRKVVTKSSYNKVQLIQAILGHVDSKIWQSLPSHINKIYYIIILSVSKDYTRRGFGEKLTCYGLDELKQKNVQGIFAECSAIKSQNLLSKLGYKCCYSILHSEFVDENNHQIFIAKDDTDSVKIMFKEI